MKKLLVCLMAITTMGIISCTSNPAKKYEGSYKVEVDRSITAMGATNNEPTITMDMNIIAEGNDGTVRIVFPPDPNEKACGEQCGAGEEEEMVFTGKVDKDGLHIDGKTLSPDPEITYTYSAADAVLEGETMTWTQTIEGSATLMGKEFPITGTNKYVATKQK